MTIEMKLPSGDEATVTERLFDVLTTARELTESDGKSGAESISFGRLYGYAMEPDADDAELERRLKTDPGTGREISLDPAAHGTVFHASGRGGEHRCGESTDR